MNRQMEWVRCPSCKGKTRVKILENTILENFPLFCPKCKRESLIHVKQLKVRLIEAKDL